MNSLYTLGVRQTSSIQTDLERMRGGESSASLQGLQSSGYVYPSYLLTNALFFLCGPYRCIHTLGQIAASLAALHRTIEDYESMARREMLKAKQEKAQMYVGPSNGAESHKNKLVR